VDEIVTLAESSGDDRRLVFARLAWPGYTAEIDGQTIPVTTTSSGLIQIDIPEGTSGELHLSWTPPGLWIGVGTALAGIAVWIGLVVIARRRHARDGADAAAEPAQVATD
jgi:uncharacterized membrane protein YfhO